MLRLAHPGSDGWIGISLPGAGYPERPFISGGTLVVVADGHALALKRPYDGPLLALGDADHAFASTVPGLVWLVEGHSAGPVTLRTVDTAGRERAERLLLPDGRAAIAAVTSAVIIQRPDGWVEALEPGSATTPRLIGLPGYSVDTYGNLIAWTETGPTCPDGRCSLHVTDLSPGGEDLVVTPPAGSGFLGGAAFSPDGRTLAAFASEPANHQAASLQLVDVATGVKSGPVAGSEVRVGEPVVAARWSSTTGWLFFSGLDSYMKAYFPGMAKATELSLPASYAFAVS